jgi:hypothetical protein
MHGVILILKVFPAVGIEASGPAGPVFIQTDEETRTLFSAANF